MRYLYNQTGRSFTATGTDQLDAQIDEGFGDVDDLEESSSIATHAMDQYEHFVTIAPPADPDSDEDEVMIPLHLHVCYESPTHTFIHTTG